MNDSDKKTLVKIIGVLLIVFVVVFMYVFLCQSNETDTINWVHRAKKPITCTEVKMFDRHNEIYWTYTLIDANSNIYYTGKVYLVLPDTIKY